MKFRTLIAVFMITIFAGAGGAILLPRSSFSPEVKEPPYILIKDILLLRSPFSEYEAEHLAKLIWTESRRYGLDPFYMLAVIEVESSFDPRAVSPKGAIGLMQLLPGTAVEVSRKLGMNFSEKEVKRLLFNPYFNVKIGIAYFAQLEKTFRNRKLATLAYFWGPSNVKRFLSASYFPSDRYLKKVLLSFNRSFEHFYRLAMRKK